MRYLTKYKIHLLQRSVASLGASGWGRRTAPGDAIQGSDTRMKLILFVAEFTENTKQTMLQGGEGKSSDERIAKKVD